MARKLIPDWIASGRDPGPLWRAVIAAEMWADVPTLERARAAEAAANRMDLERIEVCDGWEMEYANAAERAASAAEVAADRAEARARGYFAMEWDRASFATAAVKARRVAVAQRRIATAARKRADALTLAAYQSQHACVLVAEGAP